jgi:hypothetical protein
MSDGAFVVLVPLLVIGWVLRRMFGPRDDARIEV